MPPVGFEPTISAGERPKTYALGHAATGTGFAVYSTVLKLNISPKDGTTQQKFASNKSAKDGVCSRW